MRLQQLFPRIVAADYEQPKRVSEDCRHLLKRMLTPDPNKRVTIPEIMQHPWCAPTSHPALSPRAMASALEVIPPEDANSLWKPLLLDQRGCAAALRCTWRPLCRTSFTCEAFDFSCT